MGNQNQESDNDAELKSFVGEAGKDGEIIPPKAADAGNDTVGGVSDDGGDADEAVDKVDADSDDTGHAGGDGDSGAAGKGKLADAAKDAAEGEKEEEAREDDADKKPKKKQTAEQRIAHERWRRGEVERERDAFKTELETLRSGAASKKDLTEDAAASKSSAAPNPADAKYKFGEIDPQYIADTVTFHTKKALADAKAADETTRQSEAAASKKQNDATAVTKIVEAGGKEFEDFNTVVLQSPVISKELPEAIHDLLMAADAKMGAKIAYHLAANPEEARKIFGKSVLDQARYFGALEARFSAPAAKAAVKTPGAPPPPKDKAKGAGGKFSTTSDTTNFEAFEKMVDSQQRN